MIPFIYRPWLIQKYYSKTLVLIIFFIVILIISIQALQLYLVGSAYFPIDDVYIYYQQAQNLLKGEFFSFTLGGEATNSNTSVLYYFISTVIMFISQSISIALQEKLSYVVLISVVFNLFLASISIIYYYKLVNLFNFDKSRKFWLIFFTFTTAPVVFAFISGLETGLTLALLLIQLVFFLERKFLLFLILSVVLSIHRPENIVVNLAYTLILIPFFTTDIKKHIKARMIVLIGVSLAIVPLLNYLITGDIRSASAARAEFIDFIHIGYNYFMFFSSGFENPDFIDPKLNIFFTCLRYAASITIWFSIFIFIYKSIRKFEGRSIFFQNIYVHALSNTHYYSLVIVIGAYTLVPLMITGNSGEWARYLSPIFPMLFLVTTSLLDYKKIVFVFVSIVNIIILPIYIISYLNLSFLMSNTLQPVSDKIMEISDVDDTVAIDTAGLLSHYVSGSIVDVYGLGTTRYMKIHGNFEKVYSQLRDDQINYVVTWPSKIPKYYLDSAHYVKAFGENNVNEIYRAPVIFFTVVGDFPESLAIFRILDEKNK